mgnify:CR=1 FL=1
MPYLTKIDASRQIRQVSGTTFLLSGSTVIKETLEIQGNFSGSSKIFSGSTDLSKLFATIVGSIGSYVDSSGDTMTGPLIGTTITAVNITGSTISATTLSATTLYSNTLSAITGGVNIQGTLIKDSAFSGDSLHVRSSGNTIVDLKYSNKINSMFVGINGVFPPTEQGVAFIPANSGLAGSPTNGFAIFGDFRSDGYTQIRQGPLAGNTTNARRIKINEDNFGLIEIINGTGDTLNIDGYTGSTTWTAPSGITVTGKFSATTIYSGSTDISELFVNKGSFRDIYFDAASFSTLKSSGATSNTEEYTGTSLNTDNIVSDYYSFTGQTRDEGIQIKIRMPDDWDLSTIKSKIYWDPDKGSSTGDKVVWGIKGGSVSNDDTLSGETIFGTEITLADTVITPQDLHITSASTAITIAGTPVLDDLIILQISRKVNNSNDTMTQSAKLLGCAVQYKEMLSSGATQW